jgi:hypothetical protein
MYDENYVEVCEQRYGFTRVTGRIRDLALTGIDMLKTSPDAPVWQVEGGEVLEQGGQGIYVISTRRQRSGSIQQEILIKGVTANVELLTDVDAKIEKLIAEAGDGSMNRTLDDLEEFGEDEEQRLNVAFVLSIVSLSLWCVTAVFMCMLKAQLSKLSQLPAGALKAEVSDKKSKYHP